MQSKEGTALHQFARVQSIEATALHLHSIMGRVVSVFSCIHKSLTCDAGNTNFQLEADVLKVNSSPYYQLKVL